MAEIKKFLYYTFVLALLGAQLPLVFAQTLDATAPIAEPEDVTGPAFISIATETAQENEVTVTWTTDELAYGYVEYGETSSYGLTTPKSSFPALDQTVLINGLKSGTDYHYRVVAEDEKGNLSYSEDRIFETSLEVIAIDNTPPEIIEVSATDITTSGAQISWVTDELAQGKVEYGKTAEYGKNSTLLTDYAAEHSIALANLDPDTEYHYRVIAQDESGNESVSPDEIFVTDTLVVATSTEVSGSSTSTSTPENRATSSTSTAPTTTETATSPTATSTPPASGSTATSTTTMFVISHVETASVATSTATVIWKTNEPASSQVAYGLTETYSSSTPVYAELVTSHQIKLIGLRAGTNYFYKVRSTNSSGQSLSKEGFEFNTLYQQKKTAHAPVISGISMSSVGTSTATILWNTDIPAVGEVRYGPTTAYGTSDGGHRNLLTEHLHRLFGLTPDTSYNFVAIARDENGNETIYENKTFKTLLDNPSQISSEGLTENQATDGLPETITDQTTEEPEQNAGGGGGYHQYSRTITLKEPKISKVEGLDKQVMFVWSPQKPPQAKPGSTQIRTNLVIVRNTTRHPDSPLFGQIAYKGNSGLFTDTHLTNGKTYYYSVFVVNQFNGHSRPVRFKVVPTKTKTEAKLEVRPPVVQKNPIYTFNQTLSRGDRNKQVEHLQVLLASEKSIYSAGLITGYFGPQTEKAVQAFQKRYKYPATGIADLATLKKLEQFSGIEIVKDKAEIYAKAWSRDLNLGSRGGDVSVLQQFLINAGVFPEALVTGYFGNLTRSALQIFQRKQNITPASGYFGPVTKKRILNLIRLRSISF